MTETVEQTKLEQLEAKLTPPSESHFSTILNGMGNGMMLGALPPLAYDLYLKARKLEVPDALGKIGIFSTVIGCAIGAVYGRIEARRVQEYREEMSSEMTRLRADVDANSKLVYGWKAQIDAQKEHAEKKTPATDGVSR